MLVQWAGGGNLRPRRPSRDYLGEYNSRGKPRIPPADLILMDPGHKASKNPSDNARRPGLSSRRSGPAYNAAQRRRVVSSKTSPLSRARRSTVGHLTFLG